MFWNSVNDNTIDLTVGYYYSTFKNMRTTTPEGYRCDPIESSPILFLGTCDMSGPLTEPENVWSRIVYKELSKTQSFPYIALSRINTGGDSLIRRLSGYIEQYGAPKKLYIVLPRITGVEVPIRGCLITVGADRLFSDYLLKIGRINPDEHAKCIAATEFFKTQQYDKDFQLYKFEQFSMMLRMICERYDIEMKWTPNLSVTGVDYYNMWGELFLNEIPWMAQTCAGVGQMVDFASDSDGSAGVQSQVAMANILQEPQNNLTSILQQLEDNQKYLINNEPIQYDRMLRNTNR